MNFGKLAQKLEEKYLPYWEPSITGEELAGKFRDICCMKVNSARYYQLKADILRAVGRNGIEECVRGRAERGYETMELFDELDQYFLEREFETGLKEDSEGGKKQ